MWCVSLRANCNATEPVNLLGYIFSPGARRNEFPHEFEDQWAWIVPDGEYIPTKILVSDNECEFEKCDREELEAAARQQLELRDEDEKSRAACRAEQTQEHEVVDLDGLIARADETEMREWVRAQLKRKASKGGGAGADSGADSKEGARPVERRSLVQRLGLFREIRQPKE